MDEVQAFIAKNQHQLGYIMQEASRQWIEMNPTGAFTVGPCNVYIQKYGDYHKLQEEIERLEYHNAQERRLNKDLHKLMEYLRDNPDLSEHRYGESVSLIALDALKKQQQRIEELKTKIKWLEFGLERERHVGDELEKEIERLNDALKGAKVIVDTAKEQIDVTQGRNARLEKEIEFWKDIAESCECNN